MEIFAVTPETTQIGMGVGVALLILDRVFTAIKPLLTRNGRNGTGHLLAAIAEKVDAQGRSVATLAEKVDAQGLSVATLVEKVDGQGTAIATLVEKVDRQGLDAKELKRQLEQQWLKYDAMNQAVTKNTVGLDMWRRECPARSGQQRKGESG